MGNGKIGGATGTGSTSFAQNYYPVAFVQPGETNLSQVAQRLAAKGVRVDLDSLRKANPHLSDSTKLTPGQQIRLPLSAGENMPMVEGVSEPPPAPSAPSARLSDDPIAKSIAQLRLRGLANLRLGVNSSGAEVRVKREVGSPQGYDDKLQAIAVARLGGAEPAAVVQDAGGKWHAFETTAPANGIGGAVYALPSSSLIEDLRKQVIELKTRLKEFDKLMTSNGGRLPKALVPERDEAIAKITSARKQLAALLFGVPESEIQFNYSSRNKTPGKINLTAKLPSAGMEGPVFGQGKDFEDESTAFEIGLDQLENPAIASGVLFHEVTHSKDGELARKWVKQYEQETKRMFVERPPDAQNWKDPFEDWINAQAAKQPPRLSRADAELVVDMAHRDGRTTEARAFVHAALAALQAGAPEVAKHELVTYAGNTRTENHKSGVYANPKDNSLVKDALKAELQQAYRKMPKPMQQQLVAAIEAAKKANPEAWISQVKFSK